MFGLGRLRELLFRPVNVVDYGRVNLLNEERFKLKAAPTRGDDAGARRLRAVYRISDGSRETDRFPFATKETCLKNFRRVFQLPGEDLFIIADNVLDSTWEMVNGLHANTLRTSYGHGAGSWRHAAFDIALASFSDGEVVYFVEDDYLHLPGSPELLLEGAAAAHYVSLYDNIDKYINMGDGGPNHFVEYGGEITRVIRTRSSHWKLTNSTTMTFATTVGVLREDRGLWDKYTRERHPHDYQAFLALAERGRSLINPIPGYSTHCMPRWAAPGVDWERVAREYV
jgi:hypothetical protein